MEGARRASLVDEEARHIRARKLAVGASSSRLDDVERSTIDGPNIVADTTDGVPAIDGAGTAELDPPAY